MESQLDSIDMSDLKAFALALNHDQVGNLMHLTVMPVAAGMHKTNAILPAV